MKYITLILLLYAGGLPAQVLPGRYIVELAGEPAALFAARSGHRAHRTGAVFQSRASEIRNQQSSVRRSVEQSGAEVLDSTQAVMNALMVRISPEKAGQLAAIPGVLRVHPVRLYERTLDHALPLHKVPDSWNLIGGAGNAGLGSKIAIIDTGVDASHPAFQDPSLVAPPGFPLVNSNSDLAYTNNKVIVARSYHVSSSPAVSASDVEGHGTGVAMVAAGQTNTGPFGPITGVAPKAFLGNYKVFPDPNKGAPNDLIIKAIDDAVADGMDVLNLSLGSLPASRPADDVLVKAVENAVAAGKIVTVSAGNDGPDPITIGSPGTAPDAISVGNMFNDRVFAGSVQVGNGPLLLAIPGGGPNSSSPISAPLVDVAQYDPTGLLCQTLPPGCLNGSTALILRGTCNFEDKINFAQRAGAVAALIYTDALRPDPINMAVGSATLPATMVGYDTGISLKNQLAAGTVVATLVFTLGPIGVNPNRISGSSSTGPNTDYGIKPDLVAVGTSVYTATALGNSSGPSGYVVEAGTSFSAPMVAGAAALLKAARPGLTTAQYRSLLINSASPLNLVTTSGVQQIGSGVLNMLAALQNNAVTVPSSLSFGIGSGTVDQTKTLNITNVGPASDTFSITVVPTSPGPPPTLASNTVQLDPLQSRDIAVQFANNGLPAGAYQGYLQIQGTQSQVSAMVPYWYAVASGTPANLRILRAPGSGPRNSRQSIFFRFTDSSGAPILADPKISVTAGGGSVVQSGSVDDQITGAYGVLVMLGRTPGANVVHIELGGLSQDVTITGQ